MTEKPKNPRAEFAFKGILKSSLRALRASNPKQMLFLDDLPEHRRRKVDGTEQSNLQGRTFMFLEPDSSHIHPSGEDTASQETSGGWVEFVQMTDSSKKTFQESAKAILPIDACTGIVFLNPYNPEACSLTTKAIAAMLGGNWDDQSLVRWGSRITEFKQTNWKKLTKDFKKHLGLASKSKEAGRQTSELKTVSTFLSLDHARIVCDGEQTLRIYEGTPRRDFEGIKDLLACLSFDEEMSLTLLKSDGRMVVVKADSCLLDTQKSMPQAHLILIETSRSKAQALPKTG